MAVRSVFPVVPSKHPLEEAPLDSEFKKNKLDPEAPREVPNLSNEIWKEKILPLLSRLDLGRLMCVNSRFTVLATAELFRRFEKVHLVVFSRICSDSTSPASLPNPEFFQKFLTDFFGKWKKKINTESVPCQSFSEVERAVRTKKQILDLSHKFTRFESNWVQEIEAFCSRNTLTTGFSGKPELIFCRNVEDLFSLLLKYYIEFKGNNPQFLKTLEAVAMESSDLLFKVDVLWRLVRITSVPRKEELLQASLDALDKLDPIKKGKQSARMALEMHPNPGGFSPTIFNRLICNVELSQRVQICCQLSHEFSAPKTDGTWTADRMKDYVCNKFALITSAFQFIEELIEEDEKIKSYCDILKSLLGWKWLNPKKFTSPTLLFKKTKGQFPKEAALLGLRILALQNPVDVSLAVDCFHLVDSLPDSFEKALFFRDLLNLTEKIALPPEPEKGPLNAYMYRRYCVLLLNVQEFSKKRALLLLNISKRELSVPYHHQFLAASQTCIANIVDPKERSEAEAALKSYQEVIAMAKQEIPVECL